ncbi:DUF397 domain-containing protein [Streptomyces sp. C10-9-1]|uniref:DUF397 domain-containing protein n=1 Tax=Streptomyces sp. C10-9-1 TaxID=1859285 RepID=UPI003D709B2A
MTDHTIQNTAALSGWRKSSHSSGDGGSCVEVLDGYQPGIPVRDSKRPDGPALIFPPGAWSAFVASVQADHRPPAPPSAVASSDRAEPLTSAAFTRGVRRGAHGPSDAPPSAA